MELTDDYIATIAIKRESQVSGAAAAVAVAVLEDKEDKNKTPRIQWRGVLLWVQFYAFFTKDEIAVFDF